ncbi:(d)CMP kinase [Paludicola sp. MB14-C6]|uniref:(d)CMP kinase n=1 Tax=Paludihabitans sp. MB14-C6 TaxID=3070656 RepID=UPI0027DCD597|nr:(d)CMP kinase [Paludicola sp. MB14-C6]WMJ23528.1 (d)CMP kinase [Paludicola sp. MB14-C6]
MKAIAIDGPAGAGKSTIAKAIAKKIGFIYVDTGALYRAVGLYVSRNDVNTTDKERIQPMLKNIQVELKYVDGTQRVFLNGEDVSEAIRVPEMSMHASNVSAIPCVREFLFDLQRNITKVNDVIMDGRDIGTVVLPNADVKIFLTASPEVRAKRRYDEHMEKGQTVDFDKLLEEIKQRDYNDSHREIAPLKQAEDAILVDTSDNSLEQSIELLSNIILKQIKIS